MSQSITIRARLNERVTAEGVGYPATVSITGAEFLNSQAITAIAQEVVDSYYGLPATEHGYFAQTHAVKPEVLMTVPVEFLL